MVKWKEQFRELLVIKLGHFFHLDFLEADLSLTCSFSRVHSPGKSQEGDKARF